MSRQRMLVDRFTSLPELCLEKILSLLSPRELSVVASLGNRALRVFTDSDMFWAKFIPPNFHIIIARSAQPAVVFVSCKQRFNHLASLTLDMGHLIFSAHRNSGKNSYLGGCGRIQLLNLHGWKWYNLGNESRFDEVRMLMGTGFLVCKCRVDSRLLSDDTMYAAYLIFKLADGAFGFRSVPIYSGFAYIDVQDDNDVDSDEEGDSDEVMDGGSSSFYIDVGEEIEENVNHPTHRDDTWMEVKLAEFFITQDDDVMITLTGEDNPAMHGLIIEGIELRPVT